MMAIKNFKQLVFIILKILQIQTLASMDHALKMHFVHFLYVMQFPLDLFELSFKTSYINRLQTLEMNSCGIHNSLCPCQSLSQLSDQSVRWSVRAAVVRLKFF